ncbi:MAG: tetratricopeptide repeat protein [Phycisphaerales bacterium]|nr:tetratricopeptide repeat protein [Phycisphaerales bacterium]
MSNYSENQLPNHSPERARLAYQSGDAGGGKRLAARFAREPELIQAFVETADDGPDALQSVWKAVQEAVDSYPAFADLYYFSAKAALRVGRIAEAERLLQRALQLNPSYVDALILAARVQTTLGQTSAALDSVQRALRAGGDYPDVHTLLGRLRMQRNERDLARVAFERALALNPKLTEARTHLSELTGVASREEGI